MGLREFDTSGSKLASLGSDGLLNIWSHMKGKPASLLSKFSTSSHLAAAPTCLAWAGGADRSQSAGAQLKKKKKTHKALLNDSNLVAIGTASGHVHIFSTSQAKMVVSRKIGSAVLCLAWDKGSTLYVGCEAGDVYRLRLGETEEGDVEKLSVPGHHTSVHSLAVRGNFVVIGSRNIVFWNMESKSVHKSCLGHANQVSTLMFDMTGSVLFSSAKYERVISVWSVEDQRTANISSLVVNDEIVSVDLAVNEENSSSTYVGVVTLRGRLCIFRVSQNVSSGTVQPLITVSVATPEEKALRIECARLLPGLVSISYTNSTGPPKPQMEQLNLSSLSTTNCLVREITPEARQSNKLESDLVIPKTDGAVTFLAPGPTLITGTGSNRKRQKEKVNVNSLTVEDRLSLLSTTSNSSDSPKTDTLAQLLVQGLHSNDSRILNSVLDRADSVLIENTVRTIPPQALMPLVNILQGYIKGRGVINASHAKWLKSVLTIHAGYLVSVPACHGVLSPVYALLEARTHHYPQVLELRGKLEMLTKQKSQKSEEHHIDVDKEPLIVYEDESSDEGDDIMEDLLIIGNSDDNSESYNSEEESEQDQMILSESD